MSSSLSDWLAELSTEDEDEDEDEELFKWELIIVRVALGFNSSRVPLFVSKRGSSA